MQTESNQKYVELAPAVKQSSVNIVDDFEKRDAEYIAAGEKIEVPKETERHFFSFLINTLTKYDGRTVLLIGLQFFSEGAMFMICLTATIMMSAHFMIVPARATLWLALICLPEGLIFLYGIFSDCVPVFGSQRRVYICTMSIIQTITGVLLARTVWHPTRGMEIEFCVIAFFMVMSRAWLTPVIETLMLIQMKKDPDYGADDLETFGLMMEGFGMIFYCIVGGEMIAMYEMTPNVFYWLIAGTGAVTLIAGLVYPSSSDEIDGRFTAMSTGKRFKEKFSLFWQAVTLPEVRNILIFFFVVSLVSPNLEEFLIYYNEIMGVTPLFEGAAMVVLFVTGAVLFILYNNYLTKKAEVHPTAVFAILMRVISALFFAYDTAGRFNAGRALMIQSVAIRSFIDAFLYTPSFIMYTKMVPHHIEGMMIGFLWSMVKLNADVFGRLITVGLNLKFKVIGEQGVAAQWEAAAATAEVGLTPAEMAVAAEEMAVALESENFFDNLYKMYLVQAGMVAFPIFFVCLLTKRSRVEEVQIMLHHREHHSKEHPDEKADVSLKQALKNLRQTRSIRPTVHNDFPQFVQANLEAQQNPDYAKRLTQ